MMPPVSGKDADKFMDEIFADEEKRRAEQLAGSKADAAARGKEPFDLATLEQMCDTSSEGRLAPLEKRRVDFEYMYYVNNPSIMTLADFAALIERVKKW